VAHCKRKFLLSLDGFDTKFDEFRRDTVTAFRDAPSEAAARSSFEVDWLRGLLQICIEIKSVFYEGTLPSKIDFCLTIPQDRYSEVAKDRDAFRYANLRGVLDWTAIELFIMLRKRLDVLNHFRDPSGTAVDRLWKVLDRYYSGLPKTVTFTHAGKKYEVALERYILRHTFWRPRDVLKYFAKILAGHETNTKHGRATDSDAIRHWVSSCTHDIVENEFLGEFRGVCHNIDSVIEVFKKSQQVLSYDALYKKVGQIEFEHADAMLRPETFKKKLHFLYEIGFLGIRIPTEMLSGFKVLTTELFHFSDGDVVLRRLNDEELNQVLFVIHPIFCEWLRLETADHDIALIYSDKYLERNDTA
jgi:hypothetical protein